MNDPLSESKSFKLQTTWKDFKNYNEVLEFNSEGEAEEAEHFKVINIGDKYYTLD